MNTPVLATTAATRLFRRRRESRSGALTVEVAVTLPVLLMLFFAVIEFARLHMLLHSMENAVYEGARRGIVPGATAAEAQSEAAAILQAVGAVGATVTVSPSTITSATTTVTVTATVPVQSNSWSISRFATYSSFTRSCTLDRERTSRL